MKIVLALLLAIPVIAQTPTPRAHSATTQTIARRGWLGVGLRLRDDSGLEITHVDDNSPASKAGLKENDVILEVNGQKVEGGEQFARTIGDTPPGTKVNLTISRNGSTQSVSATVEARPVQYFAFGPEGPFVMPMPPEPPFSVLPGEAPRVGFEGETLTPQLAAYFGVREGVLVRTVAPNTPAEKAGLKAGDVVTKVSGTPVSSPREISGLVRAGHKTVTFTVMRNHKEITLNVEIAAARVPGGEAL
jgi:serine protease Do